MSASLELDRQQRVDNGLSLIRKADARRNVRCRGAPPAGVGHELPPALKSWDPESGRQQITALPTLLDAPINPWRPTDRPDLSAFFTLLWSLGTSTKRNLNYLNPSWRSCALLGGGKLIHGPHHFTGCAGTV
jgi:hypothetical protein